MNWLKVMRRIKVETTDKLNIFRVKDLAQQIGVPEDEIVDVCDNIESHFRVEPRTITKSDGTKKIRRIYHPTPRLKKILKNINKYLLKKIKLPNSLHGARKEHSFITNAEKHVGKEFLSNYDIEDFFPSISRRRVVGIFIRLGCSSQIAKMLARLCTADNHLPQGYNTSPAIANLALAPIMKRIEGLGKKNGCVTTAYIDDITLSANRPIKKFEKTITKIIKEGGFNLNAKTKHSGPGERKSVTGLVVNKNKVSIPKELLKTLRFHLHCCKKFGPSCLLGKLKTSKGKTIKTVKELKQHLQGRLKYLNSANTKKAASLMKIFESIDWET